MRKYVIPFLHAFNPDRISKYRGAFRFVPLRVLIPNLITLLTLCAGMTSIRMAYQGKLDFAVYCVLFAVLFDFLDGYVARLLKGTSRFGGELDSLADFVAFGVSPAFLLYFWRLKEVDPIGWIAVLSFSICAGLRLARFNLSLDEEVIGWKDNFFVGVPVPCAALLVLFPLYCEELGLPLASVLAILGTFFVSLLMISKLPVFSGKRTMRLIPREWVVLIFLFVLLVLAFLISYPWASLAFLSIFYLGGIVLSSRYVRRKYLRTEVFHAGQPDKGKKESRKERKEDSESLRKTSSLH